jgi:hypothetical protein
MGAGRSVNAQRARSERALRLCRGSEDRPRNFRIAAREAFLNHPARRQRLPVISAPHRLINLSV